MGGQRHSLAALLPGKRPGTHCRGGWVGPSISLKGYWEENTSWSHRGSHPGPSRPWHAAIPYGLEEQQTTHADSHFLRHPGSNERICKKPFCVVPPVLARSNVCNLGRTATESHRALGAISGLMQWCKRDLRPSGTLHGVYCQIVTDVSAQPTSHIFNAQGDRQAVP